MGTEAAEGLEQTNLLMVNWAQLFRAGAGVTEGAGDCCGQGPCPDSVSPCSLVILPTEHVTDGVLEATAHSVASGLADDSSPLMLPACRGSGGAAMPGD